MDELEKIVLGVLNSYAFPPVITSYNNGKMQISDGFIKDTDGRFREISKEIVRKIKQHE